MDIRQLRDFIAIVETGSFSRAAERFRGKRQQVITRA
jgi:DNA-binding transcriptional LysR family regulator